MEPTAILGNAIFFIIIGVVTAFIWYVIIRVAVSHGMRSYHRWAAEQRVKVDK
jgi:hypothetical protein